MDAIITYVDGMDPVWQSAYAAYTDTPVLKKRYRDWGTLKYLLRGIEENLPFVRNVYIVVFSQTQIPDWVDTGNVKVVLHEDIIPAKFCPTFNSTTIEMFLHKIEGLDEQFLYFNDDMFPMMRCEDSDFFQDGNARIGMRSTLLSTGLYKKHCRNSDRLARKAAGKSSSPVFMRPQHICSPMLRSECVAAFDKSEETILRSISRLREPYNLNQYYFLDYMYHRNRLINKNISNKHFSTAVASAEKICSFIRKPYRSFCCINDVQMSEEKFNYLREAILSAFEDRFPHKSRFEK